MRPCPGPHAISARAIHLLILRRPPQAGLEGSEAGHLWPQAPSWSPSWFEARYARALYWRESVLCGRSMRNDPPRVATRGGSPIVGSSAPEPFGLGVSRIAIGSSSG